VVDPISKTERFYPLLALLPAGKIFRLVCNGIRSGATMKTGKRRAPTAMRAATLFLTLALTMATSMAQPIVVGISTPLSGSAALQGQHDRWGAELAVEQVNAAGGVLGRPLQLDVQDNACNPAEGVNSVGRMLENPHLVAISGAMCSSVTLALMPIVERARVPLLVSASSASSITEKAGVGGHVWTFRAGPSDDSMAVALASYLKDQANFRQIAVLGENTDYGRGGASAIAKALEPFGVSVSSSEFYDKGAQDFTTVLTRLRMKSPDAIALYTVGADQINLIRQYRGFGMTVPLTGRIELGGLQAEAIQSGAIDGATSVFQYAAEVDTPVNRAFVQAYQAKTSEFPLIQSAITYENIKLLVDAIQRAGSVDRAAVRDAIQTSDYASMMGGRIVFDPNNQAHNNAVILKVDGGRVKVVATPGT